MGILSQVNISRAISLFQQGRLADAVALCRELLTSHPREVALLQLLAVIESQRENNEESLRLFEKAIRLAPNQSSLYVNRCNVLNSLGRYDQALQDGERAIALNPNLAEAHFNLGNVLRSVGDFDAAVARYDAAIDLNSTYVKALIGKGLALSSANRFGEAVKAYERAVALSPANAEAQANLAAALYGERNLDSALRASARALELDPQSKKAWLIRANVLREMKKFAAAEEAARIAVAKDSSVESREALAGILHLQGKFSETESELRQLLEENINSERLWNFLGLVLRDRGLLKEAAACCLKAVQLNPKFAEAHSNLSVIFRERLDLYEAEWHAREALNINPDFPEAHVNLGAVLRELGRLTEALSEIRRGVELTDRVEVRANLVGILNEIGKSEEAVATAEEILSSSKENPSLISTFLWTLHYQAGRLLDRGGVKIARRYGQLLKGTSVEPISIRRSPSFDDVLSVGFLSGDLVNHPVGYFIESILAEIDPSSLRLYAYPTRSREDDLTARIKPYFSKWHSLVGLSDEEAARRIHEDGVHILIDLAGHTAGNRLPVFAYKPAPVQATWLGYFATTGVKEIDYIIGDPYVTPESEADHFVEKIWALPETYCCFSPPLGAPEVAALPALANGFVTFGCFNNLAKVNERVIALWARVLKAVPGSKLMLKTKALTDETVKARIRGQFQERGIEADRLILEGPAPRTELLGAYGRVDIALDPFPYPGGTTSAEALWMGVPVLTKRGDRFLSHVGETIAHNSGQSEWIAQDEAEYVQKAVRFTQDLQSLAAHRAQMREKLLQSPLYDAQRFARHFEQALWGMWKTRSESAENR